MTNPDVFISKKTKNILYLISFLLLSFMILPIISVQNATANLFTTADIQLSEGMLDLSSYNLLSQAPIELNGEWFSYNGVYLNSEELADSQLQGAILDTLPKSTLNSAQGSYTYQALINFTIPEEDGAEQIVLAIPLISDSVSVYLNGVKLEGADAFESLSEDKATLMFYPLSNGYNSELSYQTLTISTNEDPSSTDLFNRSIILGELQNILTVQVNQYWIDGICIGGMLLIVIGGIIYLALSPSYSPLTLLTLFDIALMSHIFFSASIFPKITWVMFDINGFGDMYFRRLDLFFLMIAGCLGNELALMIWDKGQAITQFFRKCTNIAYLIAAVLVFIFPQYYETTAIIIMLHLIAWTFFGVSITFVDSFRRKLLKTYQIVHYGLLLFMGVILVLDIATTNQTTRPTNVIVLGYVIFFLAHLFIRSFEFKLPYLESQATIETLEQSVNERSYQLARSQELLQELVKKDALTRAYNRLYFDEQFLEKLELFNSSSSHPSAVSLCIFDLDDFRLINDKYGNIRGDGQLIDAVSIAHSVIRNYATLARIGGEEFTLLFLDVSDEIILETIEKIRYGLEVQSAQSGRTTASFGVCKASRGMLRRDLFTRADHCLRKAKRSGKNKIVYSFDGTMQIYRAR